MKESTPASLGSCRTRGDIFEYGSPSTLDGCGFPSPPSSPASLGSTVSSRLPFKSAGAQNVVVLQTLLCAGRGSPVAFETSACGMISWPFIQPLISPSLRQTETHTRPLSPEGSLASVLLVPLGASPCLSQDAVLELWLETRWAWDRGGRRGS